MQLRKLSPNLRQQHREGVYHWYGKQGTIHPIQHSAMARQHSPAVLDASPPFQSRFRLQRLSLMRQCFCEASKNRDDGLGLAFADGEYYGVFAPGLRSVF